MHDKVVAGVVDLKKLLEEWKSITEAAHNGSASPEVTMEKRVEFDSVSVATAEDIKAAMLPLISAAGTMA